MDDACPWMAHQKWKTLEEIFDRFGVKPVVAVIPDCQDSGLRGDSEDPGFWKKAQAWQDKGWDIALHGYDHVYRGNNRGLVPINARTEFAGQSEEIQRQKIRDGWKLLNERGLKPTVWIAPAHTFDRTTLRCLAEETTIRTVSDGLSSRPFQRYGFHWIPQQIWAPRVCPAGVWTICLHPNTMGDDMPERVERFLKDHAAQVASIGSLPVTSRAWGLSDGMFELSFRLVRPLKNKVAPILKKMGLKR
jgi:hypothetical protein